MEDAKSLERALRLLFELARNPEGLSITELARRLDTQRPPLYRPLQTLAKFRMVRRDDGKLYRLGTGILELAQFVTGSIADEVRPILQVAADAAASPALLLVAEGDEAVTLASVRPSIPGIHLDTPPGFVHPKGKTAPRLVMWAMHDPTPDEDPEVQHARDSGFALTRGIAAPGRTAVAAGVLLGTSKQPGAVLIVTDEQNEDVIEKLPPIVMAAAQAIQALFPTESSPEGSSA